LGVEPLRAGDVVAGKYTVERTLGAGGMGYVVLASHPILGACAIKLLHPDYAKNAELVARFVREAQAAQKIQSDHVVRVSDVGVDATTGAPYIVMERLEGQDLSQLIQGGRPLGVEEVVEYVLQACEALAEAHAEGIVHRDLKPANLFLTTRRDGTPFVKVLDFGISKMKATAESGGSALTKTSGIMGTVLYMSPEQLQRPKEVDARSDLWALGVILYELLAGRVPFAGEDMPNTVTKVILEEPEPIGALRPDVPAPLREAIARCLKKNRDERFAHVADFAAALAEVAPQRARLSIDRILGIARLGGQRLSAVSHPSQAGTAGGASSAYAGARTTTGGSVTASGAEATDVPRRSRAPFVVVGVALLVAVGVGVGGILGMRGGSSSAASSPLTSAPPKSAASEPAETSGTSSAATTASPVAVPSAPPSASQGKVVAGTSSAGRASPTSSVAATTAGSNKPLTKPSASATTATAPTAPTGAPTVNCSPPFYFDADGIKHYKPECN
jgi:serine/threonine-protein kinase